MALKGYKTSGRINTYSLSSAIRLSPLQVSLEGAKGARSRRCTVLPEVLS